MATPTCTAWARLVFVVTIEAVEGRKATRRQGSGLDSERPEYQPVIGRPRRIGLRQPSLACRHVDLMLEIIVRDLSFRSRRGGGDRRAHRFKIKPQRSLPFHRNGGLAKTALDIGIGDCARRAAARDGGEIDTALFGEPPRGGRCPCAGSSRDRRWRADWQ